MRCEAKLTSKGQITVPREIRRLLGVRQGDRVVFESEGGAVSVRPLRTQSPFAKYRAIGNPGIPSGGKGVVHWTRQLRGE